MKTPLDIMIIDECIEKIREGIKLLDPKRQEILRLWDEGQTDAAIAQKISMTRQYVHKLRHSSIDFLRKYINS